MIEDAIRKQARFAAELKSADLRRKTTAAVKRILLDSIGCMAYGSRSLFFESKRGRGSSTIIGRGKKFGREEAVFANGTAMVKHELDEGNQAAFGHPACHFLPALLAETEEALQNSPVSTDDFLAAFVAAYEISCRWGCAVRLRKGVHVHGSVGTLGAAVAAGRLRGDDSKLLASAMLLANSLPQAASWTSALNGDQIRNAYVGLSNIVGMNAREYVRMGVESSGETIESVWTSILGESVNTKLLTNGLGYDFLIERNYFKMHSACRYVHGIADIITDLMNEGLRHEEIESISVQTYANAALLSGKSARNSFAAKFSIPVSIALLLINGALDPETTSEESAHSDKVRSLAAKIHVAENGEYTKLLPEIRQNRVTVRKSDGSSIEIEKRGAAGDFSDPFDDDALIAKFNRLSAASWNQAQRQKIIEAVMNLDKGKDVDELMELISL